MYLKASCLQITVLIAPPLSSGRVCPFNQVYYQSIGSMVFRQWKGGLRLFEHINKSSKYAHAGVAPHSFNCLNFNPFFTAPIDPPPPLHPVKKQTNKKKKQSAAALCAGSELNKWTASHLLCNNNLIRRVECGNQAIETPRPGAGSLVRLCGRCAQRETQL